MTLRLPSLARSLIISGVLALAVTPAMAQIGQSAGYKFLQSIKDAKNDEVIAALEKPGVTLVNTRDSSTGEGALHIVVRRGDMAYLSYLLSKSADANLRDNKGETAMLLATRLGRKEMVDVLAKGGGNVNLANASGETPLIIAVQRRDQALVRDLLDLGADPDQADHLQGFSAREYAQQDKRSPSIAQMIDATPKKVQRAVSGPKL
ncbi:ankyrin repeat domain-containing protein [Sphingomonas sp. PAMC 26605]|uniref:ankyrin repeat domain-containing protein n=1 Tax=Sphingomonas sp. PAMC 26605 TaxID=1112214 RepID=UPI00026CD044|nr:ankyrin repeat domain-containing protein [Sphingomonas sp. PAMC 26605]